VGLIGRNGAGKSSLLKILAGLEKPDDGTLQMQQGLRIAYVAQEPHLDPGATCSTRSARAWPRRALRERYEAMARRRPGRPADPHRGAGRLELGAARGRDPAALHLDPTPRVGRRCPAARRKRVALAQALVAAPDVLLLDEPTNHLDLDAIEWLEELLVDFKGSVVLITHDRAFLDRVATRIVELDRGILRSYPGNFSRLRGCKGRAAGAEAVANARADKLLAQEEVWIRKGVEARRTRSVAASQRLEKLRATAPRAATCVGQVRLEVDTGAPSGKIVAELTDVSKRFGDKLIVAGLQRHHPARRQGRPDRPQRRGQDHAAQADPGRAAAHSGTVRQGTNLQVAYFDQMRDALDLDATLADTISPGSEWIEINGQRKHVMSYLGDFLFSPERANSPVRTLSAASATACCWRACLPCRPTCWCSTSPPTTWTSTRWNCWKNCCRLRRHGVPGQPRPALPRQRGHQHDGRVARIRRRREDWLRKPSSRLTLSGTAPPAAAGGGNSATGKLASGKRIWK
jgi:ATP-binding cassette subfamily F protein uup